MAMKQLPTRQLGKNGPTVSAIGLGAMGMGAYYGESNEEESLKTLTYAADRGMTFWDTADIYGDSEIVLGKWFAQTGRRKEIFLATKFGALNFDAVGTPEFHVPCSRPSYLQSQFKKSLARLQTDYIDLYYQHRVDARVPIEVVIEAMRPFIESGQLKWIGLSETSIETLRRARSVPGIGERVIAAQMEYSPFELYVEKTGFDKVVDEFGMSVVAYSPLGRGLVTGRFLSRADFGPDDLRLMLPRFSEENFPKNLVVVERLADIAKKYNASTSQITLAWILAEHPYYVPIPGIRNVDRLEENARGAEIQLTPEDVKAIRDVVESADIAGERIPQIYAPNMDCISLADWKGE